MARRFIQRTAVAGIAVATLFGSAACGGGFDDDQTDSTQSSGPASLQILIGSSGEAETKAVQDAAAAWASSSGNTATVTPAQDLTQQLGQAFAGGTPPDVFYVDAARFADYASVGALEPYGDKLANAGDFYDSLQTDLHLRRQVLLRAEGLLHPRPGDQHRPVGQGRADRRGHPDHLGAAHRDRRRRSRRRASPRWRSATPATGSAPSWCRPAAGSSAPTASRPPRTARRTCRPWSTSRACSPVDWRSTRSSSTPAGPVRRSARARSR